MTDLEHRLWSLELRFNNLPVGMLESRLAAVEQGAWQQSQDGGGVLPTFTVIRCARTSSVVSAKTSVAGTGMAIASDIDPTTGPPGAISTAESLVIFNWYAVVIPIATDVILGWAPNLAVGGTVGVWVVVSMYCP